MDRVDEQRLVEEVAVLNGQRRKAARKAAVRIEDLIALLQLPSKLKSAAAAGAAPTAAEHDALVADVKALSDRLAEVAAALQARIL